MRGVKVFKIPKIEENDIWDDSFLITECNEILSEIEIYGNLSRNDEKIFNLLKNAKKIGKLEDKIISRFDVKNQYVFFLCDKNNKCLAHLIIQEQDGFFWALELRSYVSGAGYGGALLIWVVRNVFKTIVVDVNLTMASANMIEKLISSHKINASIVDFKNQIKIAYNPKTDSTIPMYDKPVGNRPTLPKDQVKNFTWILETKKRREGILSQHIYKAPKPR